MLSWLFSEPLAVGSVAPDFTLSDQDGNLVRLSALRGRNVVLIFYPGDETSVCRRQLCEFRDRWPLMQEKNTVIYGVNPQSAESHAKFRNRRHFPFPLLIDRGQGAGERYHTRGLMVKRTVYLIDPDGIVRFAQRGTPAPEEVLAAAA